MNIIRYAVAGTLVFALAACNDDDDKRRTPAQSASFTAIVAAEVSQPEVTAEIREPVSLAQVMADSPETAEPIAISF